MMNDTFDGRNNKHMYMVKSGKHTSISILTYTKMNFILTQYFLLYKYMNLCIQTQEKTHNLKMK